MTSKVYFLKGLVALMAVVTAIPAVAGEKIRVTTTLPEMAEIVRKIGGPDVEVKALLEGTEDVHFMEALPSFAVQVANSDIVCVAGLELEAAWMPKVLSKSGNSKVQPGGSGYCDASLKVTPLEKPKGPIDRSMGDIHPMGNPHYHLSPLALSDASKSILESLAKAKPEHRQVYAKAQAEFMKQMTDLHKRIQAKLKVLADQPQKTSVIEFHREFVYFFAAYGISSLGAIEEKPGVPPSAARLAERAKEAKAAGVKLALGALHSPERHLQKFQELSGIPYKRVPVMVQRSGAADSIEKLQDLLADTIINGSRAR